MGGCFTIRVEDLRKYSLEKKMKNTEKHSEKEEKLKEKLNACKNQR